MNDFNSEKHQNKAINAWRQNPILKSINVIPDNILEFILYHQNFPEMFFQTYS
jgi:hypothetical protein